MERSKAQSNGPGDLRKQEDRKVKQEVVKLREDPGQDGDSLIHELKVHQVELQMRNEELRRMESQLRESRDKYQNLFDLAPIGYFTISEKGLILEANLAGAELLGVAREGLMGKEFELYVSLQDRDRFHRHQRQACKDCNRHVAKLRLLRDGKDEFCAQLTSRAVRSGAGDDHQLRTAVTDVTEGKRAEQRIHESEENYRDLFENAREAIVLIDLQGNITGVNRLVEEYGFKREDLVGKRLFDFVADGCRARALADFEVLLGGKPVKGEMDVVAPKGVICVEYRDNPIRRGDRIVGVQALLTDVTKRKRAEQRLREERDRAQRYLDVTGVMLVAIDTEERVGLINRKGCEILGCTEEDVLGKNWFDNFLPPRIRERTRAIFDGLMAGQADENEYADGVVLTQDGRERIMGWHNTVLRDETGRIIATLGSGEDVTERRRAEQQLLDYHNRLRELTAELTLTEERQRRRIAVGVHDQIGQRLALTKLTLQLLGASPVEASTARTLEGVCKEIDQVLEDAHSLTFELSNPTLHEVGFDAAVESWLAEQVQDRYGIQCTFEADEPAVRFDKDTGIVLFQIMRELLANVIKHAKATRLDVRIHRVGDRAQITVRDDGIGFELSETRFDPKSAGYGLFSTREKLEYLGGELKIESAPGRGTCISIDVPVQSRRKPRATETSP